MSLQPSGLLGVAKNLSAVTRFAFKRVESKLTPEVREQFASSIDDLCSSLERAQNQPRMVQDRVEVLQEQLHDTWSQLGQHFSDEDNAIVAQELTKYAGIPELSDYNEIFNDLLSEHGLAGAVVIVPQDSTALIDTSAAGDVSELGDVADVGEGVGGVAVVGGTGAAGIGLVTVGNVVGGAATAAGSATGVAAATTIVNAGAAAVTSAASSAAALPVVGTTIATTITSAAGTAATAGALVGSAAVAAAPVAIPVLAAWWLLRRAFRDDECSAGPHGPGGDQDD